VTSLILSISTILKPSTLLKAVGASFGSRPEFLILNENYRPHRKRVGITMTYFEKRFKEDKKDSPVSLARETTVQLLIVSGLFMLLLTANSCSVGSDDEEAPLAGVNDLQRQTQNTLNDSDLDGLSDELEKAIGRDHLTGHFPKFEVTGFKESVVTIWDFADRDSHQKYRYNMGSKYDNDLSYTPIKEKIAKFSYDRIVGQPSRPDPISPFDLGVVKLSNFNVTTQTKLKNNILGRFDELSPEMVKFESRFFLKVNNMKGIKKISNIKVEYGLVGEDGGFETFGYVEDLLNSSRTRVAFNSTGDSNEVISSAEIFLLIDRIDLGFARRLAEDGLDLALRVVDYQVETTEGNNFTYSTQITEAASNARIVAISLPGENRIIFNSRNEPLKDTIEREIGEVLSDGEGSLVEIQDHQNTTSFPIVFENGGSDHMKGESWFLFSETNSISDIPNVNTTSMIAYLRNDFIAQSSKRIIEKGNQSRNQEKFSVFSLYGLYLGETISLGISGAETVPSIANITSRNANAHVWTCGGWGGPGQSAPIIAPVQKNMNPPLVRSIPIKWREYAEVAKELRSDGEAINPLGLIISSPIYPNGIDLNNQDFWQNTLPIFDKETGQWLLNFKVTEDFISIFGDSIKIEFPKVGIGEFEFGLMSYHGGGACGRLEFLDEEITRKKSDGLIKRDLSLSVKRIFKN
jgi:hypothetical protein